MKLQRAELKDIHEIKGKKWCSRLVHFDKIVIAGTASDGQKHKEVLSWI